MSKKRVLLFCCALLSTISVYGVDKRDVVNAELELRKKSTLNDLDSYIMFLQRKIVSLEKLIAAMNFVISSSSLDEDTEDSVRVNTLKTIIEYNITKYERIKEDLKIQHDLNEFIKENLDDFLMVSSEVNKVMTSRYE